MACLRARVRDLFVLFAVVFCVGAMVWTACSSSPAPETPPVPSTSAAPGGSIAITGTVQDETGGPLPGAEVALYRLPRDREKARLRADGRPWGQPTAVATVAADGTFRLLAPEAGVFTVEAHATGRVAAESPVWPVLEAVDVGTVRLHPDRGWEVRVVDGEGEPVPGAVVATWLRADGSPEHGADFWGDGFWRRVQLQLGVADADGRARFSGLADEAFRVGVVSDGRFTAVASAKPSADQAMAVELATGSPVQIEVHGADGAPAGDAAVWGGLVFQPLGFTGSDGVLELRSPIEEPMALEIFSERDGFARARLRPDRVSDGGAMRIDLAALSELEGRVVDAVSGRPIVGAWVFEPSSPSAAVRTDDTGRFRLPVRDPQTGITAAAPGYEQATLRHSGQGEEVTVIPLSPRRERGPVVKRYQRPPGG